MVREFDVVIVGGGILGTAVANLAAAAGVEPLVLRKPDERSPQADTLRNQGWLQSGVMFPIAHFPSESAYRSFAAKTYFAGRQLVTMCGLPEPLPSGILGVDNPERLSELMRKRELLPFPPKAFEQLTLDDAKSSLGSHFSEGSTYFRIPDAPFDEAAVVGYLRDSAVADGAVFCQVDAPVKLTPSDNSVQVLFNDRVIDTSILVITAGAGSFELLSQCGIALDGTLQRTPLAVGPAPDDMPSPIFVDLAKGFSAVRHPRGPSIPHAVVMGTRRKQKDAGQPLRFVSPEDQAAFRRDVPPSFIGSFSEARFTAGYEVMPGKSSGISAYQPWMQTYGPIIFSSPGRATVAGLAAQDLFDEIKSHLKQTGYRRTTPVSLAGCSDWADPVRMHYMPDYNFNDAEV